MALGCLVTIAGADFSLSHWRPPWILVGLLDHPAHLATAGLVALNLAPRDGEWVGAFLAGSLLPDVDHIPLVLAPVKPTIDTPRPVSHCLAAVAPVAAAAAFTRDRRVTALAAGMLAHFARDLGVGSGVPLLWPATRRSVRMPYPLYAAGCALLAARTARPARDGTAAPPA